MATKINQCDGCMRGLPVDKNGIHHDEQTFGMVCTADIYKDENMTEQSKTPRTDAVDNERAPDTNGHEGWKTAYFAMLTFARALETENANLRRQVEEERAIVDRIWNMFGRPSYQSLQGRSIYDLIAEVQARAEQAEAKLAAAQAEIAALSTIFRVNILRLRPQTTHEEIDAAIDAARKETP